VCVTGRNQKVLESLSKEIGCSFVAGDLADESVPEKVIAAAVEYVRNVTFFATVLPVVFVMRSARSQPSQPSHPS